MKRAVTIGVGLLALAASPADARVAVRYLSLEQAERKVEQDLRAGIQPARVNGTVTIDVRKFPGRAVRPQKHRTPSGTRFFRFTLTRPICGARIDFARSDTISRALKDSEYVYGIRLANNRFRGWDVEHALNLRVDRYPTCRRPPR